VRCVGYLSEQTKYDSFLKILVDVSAQIPKMRIRFGGKAKRLTDECKSLLTVKASKDGSFEVTLQKINFQKVLTAKTSSV
jgi:hypothetical protein